MPKTTLERVLCWATIWLAVVAFVLLIFAAGAAVAGEIKAAQDLFLATAGAYAVAVLTNVAETHARKRRRTP